MTTEVLLLEEKTSLLDILFGETQTLSDTEKKFKQQFAPGRYAAVSEELRSAFPDIVFTADGVALLNIVYIVGHVMESSNSAKTVLYDLLMELDRTIRKDLISQEQIKYSKSSKKSAEAASNDCYRIHSVAKVLAFQILNKSAPAGTQMSVLLTANQEDLDNQLGELGVSPSVKDALTELGDLWTKEKEKQSCGDVGNYGALLEPHSIDRSALCLRPATAKLPLLAVMAGELQYLMLGSAGSLCLDAEPPSAECLEAKRLIDAAVSKKLSDADRDTLKGLLSERVVKRMGITVKLMNELAVHNPEICTEVLLKLPSQDANAYLQSLLKAALAPESLNTIVLGAQKILHQINVRTFIANRVNDIKANAGTATSSDALKEFSATLHKLVTVHGKDNKEIYISDGVFSDLNTLFASSDIPEVVSRWEEMKKGV